MVDKLTEKTTPWECPIHDIVDQVEPIRKKSHEIFWKPTIKNTNKLWWLDWKTFLDFTKYFYSHKLPNIEIFYPEQMVLVTIPEKWVSHDAIQFASSEICHKQVSRLANTLYRAYISHVVSSIKSTDCIDLIINQTHLIWFAITFIQAYDCIFTTWAKYVDTLDSWESIREDLWNITNNFTRVPSGVQEWLTASYTWKWNIIWNDTPYILESIKEAFDSNIQSDFYIQQVCAFISRKDGYGLCPASVDGTLRKTFDVLFDIYGEVLVKPKNNS